MECTICNIKYVGKDETPFNIRLNNCRKDVKDPKTILEDQHFKNSGHRFKGVLRQNNEHFLKKKHIRKIRIF